MTRITATEALVAALTADEMYLDGDRDEAWLGDTLIWKKGERHVIPIGTTEELAAGTETGQRLWSPSVLQEVGGSATINTSFFLRKSFISGGGSQQIIGGRFSSDSTDAEPIYIWVAVAVDQAALLLTGLTSYQIDRNTLTVYPYGTAPDEIDSRRFYRVHDMNIPPGSFFTALGYREDGTKTLYTGRYSGSIGEGSQLVFADSFNYDIYRTRYNLVGDFIWIIPEQYTTDSSGDTPIYVDAIPAAFVDDIIGWSLTDQRYDVSTNGVAVLNPEGVYRVAHNVELTSGTVMLCQQREGTLVARIIGRLDTPQADWNEDAGINYAGIKNKPPNSTGIVDFTGNEGQIHKVFNGNHIRAAIHEYAAPADWNATVSTDPARILNKPATMGDVATASASLGELGQYRVILRPETTGVPLPGPRQRVEQALWFRLSDLVSEIQSAEGTNIKSDWDAAAGTNAEILNKPTIPAGINQITMSGGITFNYDQITGNVTISGTAVGSSLERRVQALENA